jgi:pantoate--beta-alanine ligase
MFYLLILLLQMKLIRQITDLNKAINKENELGFVPTMGSLHRGHEFLIKISKKRCKKTLVSIFVNPTQFEDKNDYKNYPSNLSEDLKILKRLKVDFVYLPTVNQIYKKKKLPKIFLKESQKILCAKYRKGHFEGVLNVLNRFVKLISPKIMFMGEKDYQQFFLVGNFIKNKYRTQVFPCKTIRSTNGMALSSRNRLLSKTNLKTSGLIANKLIKLKRSIYKKNEHNRIDQKKTKELIQKFKKKLIKKFNIKIEYLECRNLINLSTDLNQKPYRIFVSYFLNNVRLIDNF